MRCARSSSVISAARRTSVDVVRGVGAVARAASVLVGVLFFLVVVSAACGRLARLGREHHPTVAVGVGERLRQCGILRGYVAEILSALESAELLRNPNVERNEAADARDA